MHLWVLLNRSRQRSLRHFSGGALAFISIVASAFVTTWNLSLRMVETIGAGEWTYKFGAWFAFFVLAFEFFLIGRYLWRLLAFMAGTPSARHALLLRDGSEPQGCRGWSWVRAPH